MMNTGQIRFARIARAVWLALALSVTAIWVATIASEWRALTAVCRVSSACDTQVFNRLNASQVHTLSQHGISIYAFAVYNIAVTAAFLLIWYGFGALIVWRKPGDRGALVAAFFLVVFPTLLDPRYPLSATFLTLILFGLLFPDGRFAPRWTRWLALAAMLAALSTILSDGVAALINFVVLVIVIAIQIYRFRAISTWAQRQQTKWAVFGLTVGIVGFIALLPLPKWSSSLAATLLSSVGFEIVISAIPVSIAISVLRGRLWDIDRVISRALVYTSLSFSLVGIYVGGVIGLGALFRLTIHNGSAPAIALSTLAIVALFGPLRRRIQSLIDRRFYRSRYDAARTISAFGERLRNQVDLAGLSRDLTAVVRDTLHPEHVSLWLRETSSGVPARGRTEAS